MFVQRSVFAARPLAAVAVAANVFAGQARNMATLKEISLRLKSISNIAKITKSMKMIASTKVARAQRIMDAARAYGKSSNDVWKHTETVVPSSPKTLLIACSSDRGLCGGIHSSISKATKRIIAVEPTAQIAVIGMKSKAQLQRDNRSKIQISFEAVSKNLPTYTEAALVADQIMKSGVEFTDGKLVYNQFKSVIAYEASTLPFYSYNTIETSPKLSFYEYETPVLQNFQEFTFANNLYWAIAEGNASELCAKRAAMENATKNAGEMIQKLTLIYNRSRQASITNDLIDIITGASCA